MKTNTPKLAASSSHENFNSGGMPKGEIKADVQHSFDSATVNFQEADLGNGTSTQVIALDAEEADDTIDFSITVPAPPKETAPAIEQGFVDVALRSGAIKAYVKKDAHEWTCWAIFDDPYSAPTLQN
jgi:hypothetical protein